MFWGKKNSKKDKSAGQGSNDKNNKSQKKKKSVGNTSNSQRLREEALANARKARESLGDETIQRIAAAIKKKENSDIEKAKAQIAGADVDRVLDELMWLLEDKQKK